MTKRQDRLSEAIYVLIVLLGIVSGTAFGLSLAGKGLDPYSTLFSCFASLIIAVTFRRTENQNREVSKHNGN